VAMSGIINARMDRAREVFGEETVNSIKSQCLRPGISEPNESLQAILAPLKDAFKSGGVDELLIEVEIRLGMEAKARRDRTPSSLLNSRVLDDVRHILKGDKVATVAPKNELDHEPGTATYGRKLDLQCRVDDLELNNSEFKTHGTPMEQVKIQYRKNLRINQAMMLYLKEKVGIRLEDLEVLALDVQGLNALLFSLQYDSGVFISDLATKSLLRLPDCNASWRQFLSGSTLSILLAYVDHLTELVDQIEEQTLLYEQERRTNDRCTTPERAPRVLGEFTFFSPSKRLQLQPQSWSFDSKDDIDVDVDVDEDV
ncbi:hypothetical protein BGX27_004271, partial [Mortierella sp. AM989]